MIIKFDLKKLLISIAIPLSVGGLSAFITRGSQDIYSAFNNPPLSPPGWVFPVAWSILYPLMGISLYLVWVGEAAFDDKKSAITFWGLQLAFNFIWSPIFFISKNFLLAFIVLIIIFIFTIIMIIKLYKLSKPAGLLQIPYFAWLAFAGYLNLGVYLLN